MADNFSVKKILIEIVELLGFVAFGILIYDHYHNWLYILFYVLLTSFVLLFLRGKNREHELEELKRQLLQTKASKEELEKLQTLFNGMLGLFVFVADNPTFDLRHHFSFIEEEYIILKDDGVFNHVMQGSNMLDKPSRSITMKYSGDAPADYHSLGVSIKDQSTGKPILENRIKKIKDESYLKIIEVPFPKPLKKHGGFDLSFSCRWNNTFTRARKFDYVFFGSAFQAKLGVDRFVGRLVCDLPISEFELVRLDAWKLVKVENQPKLTIRGKLSTIEWQEDNPSHIYILRFTKEVTIS